MTAINVVTITAEALASLVRSAVEDALVAASRRQAAAGCQEVKK
jgi:hypothetical protein